MIAQPGKVWRNKTTGEILGYDIYPAKSESIDNFEQVDPPVEENQDVIEVEENHENI